MFNDKHLPATRVLRQNLESCRTDAENVSFAKPILTAETQEPPWMPSES